MTLILFAVALPLLVALLAAVCFWSSGRIERAYAVGTGTSAIAAAIAVEGLLLNVGNGSSPETFYTVANVSDVTLPLAAKTVDVTNVSNNWMAEIPTLLTMGKITFKIFWVMEEVTHRNAASPAKGMRDLLLNKTLADWQLVYPDGNSSTDAFKAYVVECSSAMKVAGVFEMSVSLTANDQNPSFV